MTDFIRELYYGNLRPMSEGEIPDDLAELVTHAVDLEDRLSVAWKARRASSPVSATAPASWRTSSAATKTI